MPQYEPLTGRPPSPARPFLRSSASRTAAAPGPEVPFRKWAIVHGRRFTFHSLDPLNRAVAIQLSSAPSGKDELAAVETAGSTRRPKESTICSQVDSASRRVLAAAVTWLHRHLAGTRKAPRDLPHRRLATGSARKLDVPRIQRLNRIGCAPEKSAEDTLCPTPGTVIILPLETRRYTGPAFADRWVRRSSHR